MLKRGQLIHSNGGTVKGGGRENQTRSSPFPLAGGGSCGASVLSRVVVSPDCYVWIPFLSSGRGGKRMLSHGSIISHNMIRFCIKF